MRFNIKVLFSAASSYEHEHKYPVVSDFAQHKRVVTKEAENVTKEAEKDKISINKGKFPQQDMNVTYVNVCVQSGFIYECLNFLGKQIDEGNTALCDAKVCGCMDMKLVV